MRKISKNEVFDKNHNLISLTIQIDNGKEKSEKQVVLNDLRHLIRLKSRETVGHFPANTRGTFHQYIEVLWVVVLAQFSERSLQTHEDPGSNPAFGNFYKEHLLTYC